MKINSSLLFVSLVSCLLMSCVSGEAIKSSNAISYTPTKADNVEVLFEKPSKPYQVIGQVTSRGTDMASREAGIKMLQQQAATLGADAVVIQNIEEQHTIVTATRKFMEALAIKWIK